MNRAGRSAASERVDAAMARLTAEERRVLDGIFARKFERPETIAGDLGLTHDGFVALLNSALNKVGAFYAECDAAEARRQGRLQ